MRSNDAYRDATVTLLEDPDDSLRVELNTGWPRCLDSVVGILRPLWMLSGWRRPEKPRAS
jgi:hypothetical protein